MKTTAQLEEEDQMLAQQVDDYNDKYLEKQTEVSELSARINQMETDKHYLNCVINIII